MKVIRATVEGLNGSISGTYYFFKDINVLTGLNGSGKTTLLKAIWYMISANAERVAPEITFDFIEVETDLYTASLRKTKDYLQWDFKSGGINKTQRMKNYQEPTHASNIEELNYLTQSKGSSSTYFPTFRRIEGGYSMMGQVRPRRGAISERIYFENRDSIQESLEELSQRISVKDHRFVCSISTNDIVRLLTTKYASISEKTNDRYKQFSTSIIDQIRTARNTGKINADSVTLLNDIQAAADQVNEFREDLLRPFSILSRLTAKLFRHKGIKINAVTLGDASDAIESSSLSAGEKQMLSFLCYNAFSDNSVVFIDEPELSLHPDWQRRLFPILMEQQPTNQFIFATHSPFIYTKYSDREIPLTEEKGA